MQELFSNRPQTDFGNVVIVVLICRSFENGREVWAVFPVRSWKLLSRSLRFRPFPVQLITGSSWIKPGAAVKWDWTMGTVDSRDCP